MENRKKVKLNSMLLNNIYTLSFFFSRPILLGYNTLYWISKSSNVHYGEHYLVYHILHIAIIHSTFIFLIPFLSVYLCRRVWEFTMTALPTFFSICPQIIGNDVFLTLTEYFRILLPNNWYILTTVNPIIKL